MALWLEPTAPAFYTRRLYGAPPHLCSRERDALSATGAQVFSVPVIRQEYTILNSVPTGKPAHDRWRRLKIFLPEARWRRLLQQLSRVLNHLPCLLHRL